MKYSNKNKSQANYYSISNHSLKNNFKNNFKYKKYIKLLLISLFLFFAVTILLSKLMLNSSLLSFTKASFLNNEEINTNHVPYISTYYIKPIVSVNEDVIIDFYITDYNNMEYVKEDTSQEFTITIKIPGQKNIVKKNIKAGDNSINIGNFKNEGEQKFSILATDKYGRNSHELFNFFLVQNDININEYALTKADLIKYNISTNSKISSVKEAEATRKGLQNLLDDKRAEGYNKLILLQGTYIIDHEEPIYIPTEFTLDLNGSTIKLNPFTGDKALMIDLNNTFNSHVINGTIEGDYYEHDYENSPNNSEWVTGISISGESKYSSYENLTVKNITGYGGTNGIANSRDGSLGYTYLYPTGIGNTFKLGDIDRNTGLDIEDSNRSTSDFINIDGYEDVGYLSISRYLGYQGNGSDTWNLICHFYDENKNFIESIDGYQYRRIGVPANSKYIRVTLLTNLYPTDLSIQYFRIPTHCAFKNVKFENCRAVGLAQSAMKDMLVENCEFTQSGQSLAKCAYDAEDGWDMMQDVTFRGLNFYDNPNNDFLTCAGHNFIIEDMKGGKLYFWDRTNSYVVRNSHNIASASLGHTDRKRSGYVRFLNNSIKGNITIGAAEENDNWPLIVKDCDITGRAENSIDTGLYLRCKLNGSEANSDSTWNTSLGKGNFVDCYISNKSGENMGGIYENCTFENISGNMHGSFDISNSSISNWNCYAGAYEPSYSFKNCDMTNFQIQYGYWHQGAEMLIDNCKVNNDDYLLKLPHYSLKKDISIINNDFTSNGSDGLVLFYDDRTGGSAGELVKQEMVTIKNNSLKLDNSNYVVNGLNKDTVNNINITFKDNKLISDGLSLYDDDCLGSKNVEIIDK